MSVAICAPRVGFAPLAQELIQMRKLVTLAATALTLSALSIATPALAEHGTTGGSGPNTQYQNNQYNNDDAYRGDRDRGYGEDRGRHGDRDFRGDRNFNFDRHERSFDGWERGWGHQGYNEFRHQQPLSYWRLVRRLEAQGYYGVRGLRRSRHGFGWRAFAYTGRGRPVMLQINPYSGRVLNVRYV